MTDLQIEKAIECCVEGKFGGKHVLPDCNNCPYTDDEDCCSTLSNDIREYVKRKKIELDEKEKNTAKAILQDLYDALKPDTENTNHDLAFAATRFRTTIRLYASKYNVEVQK